MGKLAPLCQNVAALVLVCGFGVAVYSSTYASGPETVTDAPAEKALCSREFIASMCTPANSLDAEVQLNCSVDFKVMDCQMAAGRPNVISKRLRLAGASASNLVVDLAGALIDSGSGTYNHRRGDIVEVASVPLGNNEWSVPRNIVFRNAKIEGSLRVYGLGKNGEAARVKASSYNESHVEYVRKNAPSDITLESLDIKGYGRTPVYFSPGVTEVTLRQSRIHGESIRVGIYLDAESGRNSITNNIISVTTQDGSMFGFYDRGWPQIAIDGSQSNVIEGNQFYRLQQGGIYVYRNCGEGGTVRHSKPSNNRLVDNEFHYTLSSSNPAVANPAIYIGSRDYGLWENRLPGSHCNDDEQPGVKIGSAVSNADHATDTEIRGNRVHLHQTVGMYRMPRGYSLRERFIVRNPKINRGTVTADNALVVDRTRLSENYK